MLTDRAREIQAAVWPDAASAPTRVLTCRHCGKRNRVQVPVAVLDPDTCECGACRKPLFLGRGEPLMAISSTSYEHGLDRKSLEALKSVPGFPQLSRKVLANTSERQHRLLFRSNALECGPDQFPELVALLDRAARSLDLPYRPALFLTESPTVNAHTVGAEDSLIVVASALLDALDDTQVTTVLAHELGHLHADHIVYRWMANVLLTGGAILGGVPGRLLSIPLRKALAKWSRCAELTADRAGLLGTRDFDASLSVLLAVAGGYRQGITSRTKLSLGAFVKQARALAAQQQESFLDSVLSTLLSLDASHPFALWRVLHLVEWVEHGNYLDILAGDYKRVVRPSAEPRSAASGA